MNPLGEAVQRIKKPAIPSQSFV